MLALVGTVMSRSPSGNVLLRDGDGVLGTHNQQVTVVCTVSGTGSSARRHVLHDQHRTAARSAALDVRPMRTGHAWPRHSCTIAVDCALFPSGGSP